MKIPPLPQSGSSDEIRSVDSAPVQPSDKPIKKKPVEAETVRIEISLLGQIFALDPEELKAALQRASVTELDDTSSQIGSALGGTGVGSGSYRGSQHDDAQAADYRARLEELEEQVNEEKRRRRQSDSR